MRGGCSAFGYKPIAGHVVTDRVGERNCFSIGNGSSINTSSLELVNECLIVIGSHGRPRTALNLLIERVD